MFSSSPFPELPLSPNVFITPNLLFDNEKECVCFNDHRSNTDPFTSDGCFFHSPPIMDSINSTIKQDLVSQQQEFSDEDLSDAVISCSKGMKEATRASTSDGRSKIWTARGPRDRRVRLSIDISRKFFCLQDLLGFDKASKTLDWLFTKSKKAIKELVEECPFSTLDDQSKASFLESITGGSDEDNLGKEKKQVLKCLDGKKKIMVVQETNLAREQSRVMARARARERTREKMNIKKLNDKLKILVN